MNLIRKCSIFLIVGYLPLTNAGPLHDAVMRNKPHEVKNCLKDLKVEDVNEKNKLGKSALMLAAVKGRPEMVQDLLNAGANVNDIDQYENNALIQLVMEKEMHPLTEDEKLVINILIDSGATVDEKTRYSGGKTALMLAAGLGHLRMVRLLIKAQANVNEVDDKGATALMSAAIRCDVEVVKELLDSGAKETINIKNEEGLNVLKLFLSQAHVQADRKKEQERVIEMLLDAGADINEKSRISPLRHMYLDFWLWPSRHSDELISESVKAISFAIKNWSISRQKEITDPKDIVILDMGDPGSYMKEYAAFRSKIVVQ